MFSDTFTAVPEPGFIFTGWKKDKNHLCGGSTEPCALLDVPGDFTEKDIDLPLVPIFEADPGYSDLSCGGIELSQLIVTSFTFHGSVYYRVDNDSNKIEDATGLVGHYQVFPTKNDWHRGTISANSDTFLWTNDAGVSWPLYAQISKLELYTDEQNPYHSSADIFSLAIDNIACEKIKDPEYKRIGGLTGYMSANAITAGSEYGYGLSFYTAIWSMFDTNMPANYQAGHGTWITPDNEGHEQPLCPKGTIARDNWPQFGPNYQHVFQTIEGGPGYWAGTQFPARQMKYRANGTTDCYNSQHSSPGWEWGGAVASTPGLVHLSNRFLYPPDGITFEADANGRFLGNAWMALPLTQLPTESSAQPSELSWTLFLNATNFSGPILFWLPQAWQRITSDYPAAQGRGLDTLPTNTTRQPISLEIGAVAMYESTHDGVKYGRIPRLRFPVDENARTIFQQDVKSYDSSAIFDLLSVAISEGSALPSGLFAASGTSDSVIVADTWNIAQQGEPVVGLEALVSLEDFDSQDAGREGVAYGLQWTGAEEHGVFPEYYRVSGDRRIPIAAADVPTTTGLFEVEFSAKVEGEGYVPPTDDRWGNASGGEYSVTLADGSILEYGWYKFVEQPAIAQLRLSAARLANLQGLVEQIHEQWGIRKTFMAAPSTGEMVTIDNVLIVTPPMGMEVGYVPVVIRQTSENAH